MNTTSILKSGFAGILAALFLLLTSASVSAEEKASISFDKTTHDFGIIKDNKGPVTYEFKFTNKGDANLIIKRAKAECGCTAISFPQNPVAPGKSSTITVKYSPLGQRGSFNKSITVWTNAKQGKVTLKIKGSVVPASEK